MHASAPRVLIVEDDDTIRDALIAALENEGLAVRGEADGSAAGRTVEQFRPDLVILDVDLGTGPDGYTLARRVRTSSDLPILFVTAADAVEDRLAGFEAGGDDYLVKPFSMAELVARVLALLRRAGRVSSVTRQIGPLVIDDVARTVVFAGQLVDLRRKEYDLLAALVRHMGQVLTKTQLLTQVWGFDAYEANLVEVQMSSLRRKLEAHGPRMVHTVHGVGYVFRA